MKKKILLSILILALQAGILSGCEPKNGAGECCGSSGSYTVQEG